MPITSSIRATVLIEHRLVTDTKTDGYTKRRAIVNKCRVGRNSTRSVHSHAASLALRDRAASRERSVPKIIINNTTNYFLTAISILVISEP